MTITVEYHRFEAILRGWGNGLNGRDPDLIDIQDLLPAIYAACPGAPHPEIIAALRWGSGLLSKQAAELQAEARSIRPAPPPARD
jgi:hypothetical protein